MSKELFNLFVILFPLSGVVGGFFHFLIAMHYGYTLDHLPKWFKITFIANIIITSLSGLIILIFYNP